MRVSELKKYKPLDITQISGSPWNTAEKVLGLDENKDVVMAKPEGVVTPEDVTSAITEAMEVETARTEAVYAKIEDIPEDYATEAYVDRAITAATQDLASKEYVDEAISGVTVDLSDYYTKEEVDAAISGVTVDLSDYYTKEEVDTLVAQVDVREQLENYALTTAVTQDIQTAIASETARTESTYAKPSDIPSLTGYATENYVDNAITAATEDMATTGYVADAIAAIPSVDLSPYAKTTAVTEDIQTAIASETARTEATYAKVGDIPSLDGYWTSAQTESAITAATDGLATETYVDNAICAVTTDAPTKAWVTGDTETRIETAMASETARTESVYAKPGDIPSLDGYATEAYVTAATQDMATKTWVGEQGYLTEHQSLEDYYTKEQVDAEITGATEGMATTGWVESQGYLTEHQDLSAYAPTTAVTEDIQSAIAAETARTEQTYAKPSDIPSLTGYSTTEEMNEAITAATATTTGWVASQNYLTQHQSLAGLFDDVEYVSSSKTINFYDQGDNLVGQVDATDFIKDGMVDNVYITGSTLVISFNTDAGQEDIEIALTDIFNPANYYDKTAIDVLFASETARTENTYLKEHQDLSDYALTTAVTQDIQTAMAAETARTESTYAKPSQIPSLAGYATEQYVDESVTAATATTTGWVESQNYLTEHQDLSDYALTTAVTADIATAMAAETARTEETYAKPSQIPSLAGYATENYVDAAVTAATEDMATTGWVSSQGYLTEHQDLSAYAPTSAVTEDIQTAIASETARTEETYATLEDVYGVTAVTQMQIIDTAATQYQCRLYAGSLMNIYFKETNITGYLAIRLNDTFSEYTGDDIDLLNVITPTNVWLNFTGENYTATTENLGTYIQLSTSGSYAYYIPYSLDNTYDYYLVFNVGEEKLAVFKTLPVVDVITRTVPAYEDIPVAQDGSGKKVFVYSGDTNNKKVLADFSIGFNVDNQNRQNIVTYNTPWGGSTSSRNIYIPEGTNQTTGVKTFSDSDIIFDAGSALAGFSEQITLTLGNQSATDYVYGTLTGYSDGNFYLWETDNPRYEVLPFSGITTVPALASIRYFSISSVTYYNETYTTMPFGVGRKGKLSTKNSVSAIRGLNNFVGENCYLIIDKETKQWEFTYNSLTITRAKTISDLPTKVWTTGDTETRIETAIAAETARTESVYAKPGDIPSLSGYATEAYVTSAVTAATDDMATKTWVGQQGYLTQHQDISGKLDTSVFTGYTGATETVLSGKVDNSVFTGYTGDTSTALAGKVDTSAYTAYTASTDTAISGKQETLVSGTNIKTINEQSILGSGNSCYAPTTAGTAGQPLLSNGSGAPVWGSYKFAFITQTAYDNLGTKDSTTIYFIIGN